MDEIAQKEKNKYEILWRDFSYGECSLGEFFLPHFWTHFQNEIQEGDLLADFGCGCGRAAKEFLSRGLRVLLVDFCSNCLDDGILTLTRLFPTDVQFIEACLWDLPKEIHTAEWIYCCDVLEHIPESHVDRVLVNLEEKCVKGGYLSICMREDLSGKKIGETLHLTVRPKEWWLEKISQHFVIEKEIVVLEGVYLNCCIRKKGAF